MSDLPAKIVAGLDYWYGRAVFPLLYPSEHTERDLEAYLGDVRAIDRAQDHVEERKGGALVSRVPRLIGRPRR